MKTIILSFVLVLSVLSCEKVDEFTKFTIKSDTESVIESVIGINLPITIMTPPITTNVEQKMEEENSNKDLIEYANLTQLILTTKSPESSNFDFLNQIEIFIKANGLAKQKIASKYNIPETGLKTLDLTIVPNIDLTNYIKADSYSIEISVETDQVHLQDVTLGIHSEVFVDAKILGL